MHSARPCRSSIRPRSLRARSTKSPLAKSSKWFKMNSRRRGIHINLSWFLINSNSSKIQTKTRDSQHLLHRNRSKTSESRPPRRRTATALKGTTTRTGNSKPWLRAPTRSKAAVAAQACRNSTWFDAVRLWGSSRETRREKVHQS